MTDNKTGGGNFWISFSDIGNIIHYIFFSAIVKFNFCSEIGQVQFMGLLGHLRLLLGKKNRKKLWVTLRSCAALKTAWRGLPTAELS
ncbi:hypothetical protein ES703_112790 [subsurface metagenome]